MGSPKYLFITLRAFLSLSGRFEQEIHTRIVTFDAEHFRIYAFKANSALKASYRPFLKNLRSAVSQL